MKYWLISDDDVRRIRDRIEFIDTMNSDDQDARDDALHTLSSGLHTTDAVPADYQDSGKNDAE